MKDLRSYFKDSQSAALAYTTVTGTATGAGTNVIDRQGYESVTFFIHNHACNGTGVVSFSMQSGSASGSLSAVATSNIVGATSGFFTSGTTGVVKSIGYIGGDRYVRLDYSATGTATGATLSAVAVLGSPLEAPTVSATA